MTYSLEYLVEGLAKRRDAKAILRIMDLDAKFANGVFFAETRQALREKWLALKPTERKKLIAKVVSAL